MHVCGIMLNSRQARVCYLETYTASVVAAQGITRLNEANWWHVESVIIRHGTAEELLR